MTIVFENMITRIYLSVLVSEIMIVLVLVIIQTCGSINNGLASMN